LKPTWDSIVAANPQIKDFSPASQEQGAAYLARTEYQKATGGDLETDLKDPANLPKIAAALRGQWPTLSAPNIATAMNSPLPDAPGLTTPSPTMVASAQPSAATPSPAQPTPNSSNPLQQLAMLNKLMAPQQAKAATPSPYNAAAPWLAGIVNSLPGNSSGLQNTLQVAQNMASMQGYGNPLQSSS
jgi:hypothetical protein